MLNEKYHLNRYIQKYFKIKTLFCQISNTLSITVIQTIILPATKFENTVLYHKKFGKNNRPLIKSILDTMGCEKDTCTWKSNRNLYMCSLESILTNQYKPLPLLLFCHHTAALHRKTSPTMWYQNSTHLSYGWTSHNWHILVHTYNRDYKNLKNTEINGSTIN